MNSFKIYLKKFYQFPTYRFTNLKIDTLQVISFITAAIVIIPLVVIIYSFFTPADTIWKHLYETVLADIIINTLLLVFGVGFSSLIVGVSLAWLTTMYQFPGRKIFEWTLMLPLAMPVYVIAFVSIGLLEYTGPIQTTLRNYLGGELFYFPAIRSTGGVIIVMTLALYPYVYLLSRNAFATQGKKSIEVAQSLGYTRMKAFFKSSIPMARPWIAGGVLLVMMETLADFGAVSIFNYNTLTTEIYKTWFSLFSLTAASQLASVLIIIVFIFIIIEQRTRFSMRFHQPGKQNLSTDKIKLTGLKALSAFSFCFFVLLIAFIIPVTQLFIWGLSNISYDLDIRYLNLLKNSLLLGVIAAAITTIVGILLSYGSRFHKNFINFISVRISTLGYALPGAVLAVGIFIPFAWLDNKVISLLNNTFNINSGLIFNGTLFTVITAYIIRFLAVAYSSVDSAFQRIAVSIDESVRSMGLSKIILLKKIHLPLIKNGIFTALILVFVDVMKEMPITLMTRPFGWDTLAVRIFELTSEGEWQKAALPAIAIVIAGLIPIKLLMKHSDKNYTT